MRISFILILVFSTAAFCSADEVTIEPSPNLNAAVSDEVGAVLAELYASVEAGSTFFRGTPERALSSEDDFGNTLGKLESLVSEQDLGNLRRLDNYSEEIAMLNIAINWDETERKRKELIEFYQFPAAGNPDAELQERRIPSLLPEHCTEEYRHAWESLLIGPISDLSYPMYSSLYSSPLRALAIVGNEESIPLLILAFKLTCLTGSIDIMEMPRQYQLLWALSTFHNELALDAMFQCLDLKSKSGQDLDKVLSGKALSQWLVEFIVEPRVAT